MGSTSSRRSDNRQHEPSGLAIGYARVSTDAQAEEGVSLSAQVAAIQRYAATIGVSLGCVASAEKWPVNYPPEGVFVDGGVGGKTPIITRPEGAKVVTLVRGRFVSHIIVTKQDRLSRNVMDIAMLRVELMKSGVTLHLVDEGGAVGTGPSDRLLLGIRGELAQWQREVIGASTQSALDHKRTKGEKLGGPVPYGYRVWTNPAGIKELKLDPEEQAVIGRARQLRAEGMSYTRIGKQLFEERHPARNRGPWHPQQIANMMEKKG